jgi:hypothetical protein
LLVSIRAPTWGATIYKAHSNPTNLFQSMLPRGERQSRTAFRCSAGHQGQSRRDWRPAAAAEDASSIKLSLQAWRALQTEADRLGTSAGRLARLIVETVARDNLVSAVIDTPGASAQEGNSRRAGSSSSGSTTTTAIVSGHVRAVSGHVRAAPGRNTFRPR